MFRRSYLVVLWLAVFAGSALGRASLADVTSRYRVVHVYLHDPRAFTQGLIYRDGHLYESTGLNGRF
jgi:glutamine cyclotransferase